MQHGSFNLTKCDFVYFDNRESMYISVMIIS